MASSPNSAERPDPRQQTDRRPIAELLAHAGRELRTLCTAAHGLEIAMEALVGTHEKLGPESMRALQELDRMIQHIDGLADYLGGLSDASEGLGVVDAAAARRRVKLARLAAGLAGEVHAEPSPDEDYDDFELL